jgi:hypothetical protein
VQHGEKLFGLTWVNSPLLDSNLAAGSGSMMDIAVLAIGLVFFAASIAYVYACDRL